MHILYLQLYGLFFSAAGAELVSEVSRSSLVKAFESGVQAIMKYGRGIQGDRTMVGGLDSLTHVRCRECLV